MSLLDRLFPPAEQLEELGNLWHEPANKKRRLNSSCVRLQTQADPTPANLSLSDFIETCIERHCKQHLHPNEHFCYLHSGDCKLEIRGPETRHKSFSYGEREVVTSPPSSTSGSLASRTSDEDLTPPSSASPTSSEDLAPPSSLPEHLAPSPFGYVIDGLRLTGHERLMVYDLLSPGVQSPHDDTRSATPQAIDLRNIKDEEYFYQVNRALSQRSHFDPQETVIGQAGCVSQVITNADENAQVSSSCLGPACEVGNTKDEDEDKNLAMVGIGECSYLSVDDILLSLNSAW